MPLEDAPSSRDNIRKRKVADMTYEARLARDRNKKNGARLAKRQKMSGETHQEYEARLVAEEEDRRARAHNKYLLRKAKETPKQHAARLSNVRKKRSSKSNSNPDQKLLRKFCTTINNFKNNLCTTCNERFPSIVLVGEECYRCHKEKNVPKRFSAENNMDPGMS